MCRTIKKWYHNGESYVRYDVGYVSDPCGNNIRH